MTRVFGIIGTDVSKSRSPRMHNAAFKKLNIDATYVPFNVATVDLTTAVSGLRVLGVSGFNVTVPHKENIIPLLDEIEPDARAIGAVNTVLRIGGRYRGTNTDARGLVRALEETGVVAARSEVAILGAGGAARAAVMGLGRGGATRVHVVGRRPDQVERVVNDLSSSLKTTQIVGHAWDPDGLKDAFKNASLIVQTTDAPMKAGAAADEFAEQLPFSSCTRDAVVIDIVVQPRVTSVMQRATEHGLRVVDGLGMLLYQGALAFELWTSVSAPIEEMRRSLLEQHIT